MKLTKSNLSKLKPPESGQSLYRDDLLKGFGVRITANGVKSFIIEKRINGKVKRITLGRYPALTVEMARQEAQKIFGKILSGIDPLAEKKEANARSVTLAEAFTDYLSARKSLKQTTIKDYHRVMQEAFSDWQKKPLLSITKDMVAKRHTKLGLRSHARANLSMRVLRAIFNFASGEYENAKGQTLIQENPVSRLSHTRAWYRVNRRQTVIARHELASWHNAIITLKEKTGHNKTSIICDYLLFILLTGLRRQEAAQLQWSQIDFNAKTITITETKNHQQHALPLSDYLYTLLSQRKAEKTNQYVFPGDGKNCIVEPRKVMAKITKISGVTFTIHDLRRTFITIAESLDIPAYALKRLLNHKTTQDVTAGYIVMDVERLRQPMQAVSNYLQKLMTDKPQAKVIDFDKNHNHLTM